MYRFYVFFFFTDFLFFYLNNVDVENCERSEASILYIYIQMTSTLENYIYQNIKMVKIISNRFKGVVGKLEK